MITINFTPKNPLSPKTSRVPTMQQVFFLRRNTFDTQFKLFPETSSMKCHTTTPKILHTFILSLVLVPKETHVEKPFLKILNAIEFLNIKNPFDLILIQFCVYFPTPEIQHIYPVFKILTT
jgi:hypothetical protein